MSDLLKAALESRDFWEQACAEKDATIKTLCADWADDDTTVKKLAAPYIGDFDDARSPEERGLGFRGVIEVTEAVVAKLAEREAEVVAAKELIKMLTNSIHELREEIARLKGKLRVYEERNSVEINLVADALAKKDLEIVILKADRSALLDGSNVTKLQEQNRSLRSLLERVPHVHPMPPPSIADKYPECIWSATCVRCAYEMTLAHEKLARETKTQA